MNAVTIIGAGFGALTAAQTLRKLDRSLRIDLIAPRPVFAFYPGMIWIPTGKAATQEMEVPLKRFFDRMRVSYHPGKVRGMSPDARSVQVGDHDGNHDGNHDLANDGLIIASGTSFRNQPAGCEHSFRPCGGVAEIKRLTERLHALQGGTLAFGVDANPDESRAVRSGPVFEIMFGIERWLQRHGRRDAFRLVFFSSSPEPGGVLGPRAAQRILAEMHKRGIETRLGVRSIRFDADRVVTDQGEFGVELIVYMPGLTGQRWLDQTPLPRSAGGLIAADERCRVAGLEQVYVVGDAGSPAGPDWLPKRAHLADLQAAVAARNLVAELQQRPARSRFKPELVCVVDTGERAMLITRSASRALATPPLRAFHWAKRLFKWNYLRKYR